MGCEDLETEFSPSDDVNIDASHPPKEKRIITFSAGGFHRQRPFPPPLLRLPPPLLPLLPLEPCGEE